MFWLILKSKLLWFVEGCLYEGLFVFLLIIVGEFGVVVVLFMGEFIEDGFFVVILKCNWLFNVWYF